MASLTAVENVMAWANGETYCPIPLVEPHRRHEYRPDTARITGHIAVADDWVPSLPPPTDCNVDIEKITIQSIEASQGAQ
jgi:hypothetical protein